MKYKLWIFIIFVTCCISTSTVFGRQFEFELLVIDGNYNQGAKPGWTRMGDMDQDGKIDIVAGGGNHLAWYKNPGWGKALIGDAGCNGGVLYDVDRDGDLDVLSSVKNEGNKLFWFENPNQRYPKGENKENWVKHLIDDAENLTFQHDIETGDINMDGVPDDFIALYDDYRTKRAIVKWYRNNHETGTWGATVIADKTPGGVGLAIGDIDGDSRNDVIRGGAWYEAPEMPDGKWIEHIITESHLTNVRVADLDADDDLDIVAASGWEDAGPLVYMENRGGGKDFTIHSIDTLTHPENIVLADLNGDGSLEIITGEMKGLHDSTLLVYSRKKAAGDGDTWEKHTVNESNGVCARMNALDFDGDGDLDIVCDGNSQSHIYLWINNTERPPADDLSFKFTDIDSTYAPGWIRHGDMDGDGDTDLVSGGGKKLYIYENTGDAKGWRRHGTLETVTEDDYIGCNAAELYDVDGDGDLDIVAARYYKSIGWWENPGGELSDNLWKYRVVHECEGYYLHDMLRTDMDGDGKADELVVNINKGYWNAQVKVLWFKPDSGKERWDIHEIERGRKEAYHGHAGLDKGDIDGDGDDDLAFANGWYECNGNPDGTWSWHEVSTIYGISNNLIRDIDHDGDMDLAMSAGHHGRGAYWYENTEQNGADIKWKLNTIDPTVHNPEGLQVLDIDSDGDLDVFAVELFFGEAPGESDWSDDTHNLYLYRNNGGIPQLWEKINIAPNKRPCHSFMMADINGDGKQDIIAESSGAPGVIYIENTGK